jgi:hypothetical protein
VILNRKRAAGRLDDLLEGRGGVTGEHSDLRGLALLAQTLRDEASGWQLDPELAEAQLAQALRGDAPAELVAVAARRRQRPAGRRAMAVALVAAMLGTPTAVASARSVPGDALYPVKRTIERVRLGAARSAEAAATARLDLARERLGELRSLVRDGRRRELPAAAGRLRAAMDAAAEAVADARAEGVGATRLAALEGELGELTGAAGVALSEAQRAGPAGAPLPGPRPRTSPAPPPSGGPARVTPGRTPGPAPGAGAPPAGHAGKEKGKQKGKGKGKGDGKGKEKDEDDGDGKGKGRDGDRRKDRSGDRDDGGARDRREGTDRKGKGEHTSMEITVASVAATVTSSSSSSTVEAGSRSPRHFQEHSRRP